ncbi:MAG TPA: SCO family protein [Anaerolineales bacterium]|nr:SCO family protein [Anaerolineales bacterium]
MSVEMSQPIEPSYRRRPVMLALVITLALLGATLAWFISQWVAGEPLPFLPVRLHGTVIQSPSPVTDFELQTAGNKTVRLSDLQGKLVLLAYGYTACPDVCPVTMTMMRNAFQALNERQQSQVQVVFISVDPQRDTPEKLQEYVSHFHPAFLGLTGTPGQILAATTPLGIYFDKVTDAKAPDGYWMDHTATVSLLDKEGYLRVVYPFNTPAEDIAKDLKVLVR